MQSHQQQSQVEDDDSSVVALSGDMMQVPEYPETSAPTSPPHTSEEQQNRDAVWKAEIAAALQRTSDARFSGYANVSSMNINETGSTQSIPSAAYRASWRKMRLSTATSQGDPQPGAVPVSERAYGSRPAWSRPVNATEAPNSQNNNHPGTRMMSTTEVPPEMRILSEGDPSHTVATLPLECADREGNGGNVTAQPSSSCSKDDKSDLQFNKRNLWILVGIVTMFVLLATATSIGFSVAKKSDQDVGYIPSNSSMNQTELHGNCPEYKNLPQYGTLDYNATNGKIPELYFDLLGNAKVPATSEEYCSAINMARVWVASMYDEKDVTTAMVTDQLVLATLYFHWRGSGDTIGWLQDSDKCAWTGITCNTEEKIVEIKLTLEPDSELLGGLSLPTEIGLLTHLKSLRLRDSGLSGSVPPDIEYLTDLAILDLRGNDGMTGTFPFEIIADLTQLRCLSLPGDSDMTIGLPDSLAIWPYLEVLGLAKISEPGVGLIPNDAGSLSNLKFLDLSWSGAEGSLDFLYGLRNMTFLALNYGSLGGTIPTEVGLLDKLEWMFLSNNPGLYGPLPSEVGQLSHLAGLHLDLTNIAANGEPFPSELLKSQSLKSFTAPPVEDTVKIVLSDVPNIACLGLTTSFLSGSLVSTTPVGTCSLPFEDGIAFQDGKRNHDCNSMNRANCECCEQYSVDCGDNPLLLKQCAQVLQVDDVSWRLEARLIEEIAQAYVYT